jgi:hypothetical protein
MSINISQLMLAGAPVNGAAQVETATVIGTITGSGNATVVVTASGMTNSPKTVSVAVIGGTLQVETATVVGTIGASGAGNASVTVTAAGMTGSPKAISVAVANNDSASTVGGKIRTELNGDSDVTDFFTVSGSGANVVLTAKVKAANDATMNIAIDNDTCSGLTAAPTSANTTAGVVADTASVVAGKIRTALTNDADVGVFFAIGGTGADVVATAATKGTNDTSMNISIDNGTCTGLTTAATSTNTTAGVKPTYQGVSSGAILVDTTNGQIYSNTGTASTPAWTPIS